MTTELPVAIAETARDPKPYSGLAPERIIVWRERAIGKWTFEPRDRYGRVAWRSLLAWNRHGGHFRDRASVLEYIARHYRGLKVEVVGEPAPIKLDAKEGARRAADGIARADEHAPPEFKRTTDQIIEQLATSRPTFTADEVWAELAARGVPSPPEPRALGGRLQSAARGRNPKIESTGRTAKSKRPEAHGSFVTVWRSLLFTDANPYSK